MSWTEVLLWSDDAFPLSEFVSRHERSLPVIIKLKTGVYGEDPLHDFSADEVYRRIAYVQ